MHWFDVDGARLYLAARPVEHTGRLDPKFKPTRKVVYNMVAAGMKVARLGDKKRRLMFSAEWIDQHLTSAAQEKPKASVEPIALVRSCGGAG
jgi:hypothetical protein